MRAVSRDIGLHEYMARIALHGPQVLAIARIGERIYVHNANIIVLIQHIQHKVRADEPGTSGNQIGLHNNTPCSKAHPGPVCLRENESRSRAS